jgi:hypothetical protein
MTKRKDLQIIAHLDAKISQKKWFASTHTLYASNAKGKSHSLTRSNNGSHEITKNHAKPIWLSCRDSIFGCRAIFANQSHSERRSTQ